MTGRGEDGSAVLLGGLGLVITVLVLASAVDVTVVLVTAARAQATADAAALAAVGHAHASTGDPPAAVARRVAGAAGGELLTCRCPAGARRVRVEVAVPLSRVWLPGLRGRLVVATASAHLVREAPT